MQTRASTIPRIRAVSIAVLLLAGCGGGSPPSGPPASAAPSTAAAPSQGAPATSSPMPAGMGSWTVTVSGDRIGSGTYTGTGQVICAAPLIDGQRYWTATAVIFDGSSGALTDFSISQGPDGRETISATTGGMEQGSWQADSSDPTAQVSTSGSGQPGMNGVVTGTGTASAGGAISIEITAHCSETHY